MAEDAEDDELLLDDVADEPDAEEDPPETPESEPDDEPDGLSVSFGDDDEPGEGDDLVSHLRRVNRDQAKQLSELRRSVPAEKPPEIGDKPTLEACGYDEAKYETDLLAWNQRKAAAEGEAQTERKAREATETAFREKLQVFARKRDELKAPDFEDAESLVVGATTQLQQTVLLQAADDPARLFYALGKHPAKLAELAAITNPIELIKAVVKLEGTIRVTNKKKAPEPEGTLRGSGQLSRGKDAKLERLEREADRTGDRTLVVQYKRSLKDKAR